MGFVHFHVNSHNVHVSTLCIGLHRQFRQPISPSGRPPIELEILIDLQPRHRSIVCFKSSNFDDHKVRSHIVDSACTKAHRSVKELMMDILVDNHVP
jgi:hypothetical protein